MKKRAKASDPIERSLFQLAKVYARSDQVVLFKFSRKWKKEVFIDPWAF